MLVANKTLIKVAKLPGNSFAAVTSENVVQILSPKNTEKSSYNL